MRDPTSYVPVKFTVIYQRSIKKPNTNIFIKFVRNIELLVEQKHFNLFLKIFEVVGMPYGVSMIILPQLLADLHWKNPPGSESPIIVRGWGLTLFGLAFIAFNASERSLEIQNMISRGIFFYFGHLAVFYLVDMIDRGLVIMGPLTYVVVLVFATSSGYFGFVFTTEDTSTQKDSSGTTPT